MTESSLTKPAKVAEEERRVFLTAQWRNLAMLNYVLPPEILEPHVPAGTELDTFEGKYYVSVVGFQFLDTRVLGLPIPFHRKFEEINLRFYVTRQERDERRRGVVFIKEIVPKQVIAAVANTLYGEHYSAHPMFHRVDLDNRLIEYGWHTRERRHSFGLSVTGEPALPDAGSEPEFITEHYWGYTKISESKTREYRVEHPQWNAWDAALHSFEIDVESTFGSAFAPYVDDRPTSAFVADGSAVSVRMARKLSP